MDIPDLSGLGALGVPAFVAIFLAGWKACDLIIVKDLRKDVADLREEVEENRREKDTELLALREKVRG